jgi:hypothetical protein
MDFGRHQEAQRFRELNGTAGLEQTLDKAVGALYRAEIPHLVTGGNGSPFRNLITSSMLSVV